MKKWYPEKLIVHPKGTKSTYDFMKNHFAPLQHFHYAEFGFYEAATAKNICQLFPNATLHLFDFQNRCDEAKKKLKKYQSQLHFYGNTEKYNDSYNWSLINLFYANQFEPIFDYCFLDGAHTFAVDALTFFLCDRMLKVGGFIDFDDYNWRLRGSSLDPNKVPEIADQYTDEQIHSKQVKLIVDGLVKTDPRYKEIVPNKIYQKIANHPSETLTDNKVAGVNKQSLEIDKLKQAEALEVVKDICMKFGLSSEMLSNMLDQNKRMGIKDHLVKLGSVVVNAKEKHTTTLFAGDDALFKRLLPTINTYFEYGCGQSTKYVYGQSKANIYAVDTSQEWAEKVNAIAVNDTSKRLNVKWIDVGPVRNWGYATSLIKKENFKQYTDYLWSLNVFPDLVLIDGRFRVCCFLTTVKYAPIGTKILFDDYNNRPHYHIVEDILKVVERCGRQALFIVDEQGKKSLTEKLIEKFRNVQQ